MKGDGCQLRLLHLFQHMWVIHRNNTTWAIAVALAIALLNSSCADSFPVYKPEVNISPSSQTHPIVSILFLDSWHASSPEGWALDWKGEGGGLAHVSYSNVLPHLWVYTKEDGAEVTLGISIKIPHTIHLNLSQIRLRRIKMLSYLKFIYLCL